MFQLKTEDRLRSWREFRYSINNLNLEQALRRTVELWARAPFTPYNLDINTPENWPDPWQLVEENVYCDIAKSLGIMYTIMLTDHRSELTAEFRCYQDDETRYEYNLSWFNDGKYITNLVDNEIINIKQFNESLKLLHVYSTDEIKIKNYY